MLDFILCHTLYHPLECVADANPKGLLDTYGAPILWAYAAFCVAAAIKVAVQFVKGFFK